MVVFGILLGLVVLAIPVAVIVLLVGQSDLRRRLGLVEAELRALGADKRDRGQAPAPALTKPATPEPAKPQPAPPAEAQRPKAAALAANPGQVAKAQAHFIPASPNLPRPASPPIAPTGPSEPNGFDRAIGWLGDNWFYAISAVSLGLAGIFLVQYSVEKGLLPPGVRVILAMIFGAALIGAGEYIRRRWGDGENSSTALLPSTFSSAGIVVLYASIVAARSLHGLIGPELAFAGLVSVSAIAMIFGWFYGPFLAAAGLIGAAAVPFLVSSGSNQVDPLQFYYALIGATGLLIDAIRRWGWVSYLALGLAYTCGSLMFVTTAGTFPPYAALLLWLALAAIALPRLQAWPSHPGPTISTKLLSAPGAGSANPVPPTWIAAGAVLATSTLLFIGSLGENQAGALLAAFGLIGLLLALILWTRRAPGLADLAAIPAVTYLLFLLQQKTGYGALYLALYYANPQLNPEAAPSLTVPLLVGLATLGTLAAAWRSFRDPAPKFWALGAVLFAPVTAVLFELFWGPAPVIGAYLWAGVAISLAALMTILAERYAKADAGDMRRAAWATLSSLSLIALALFILLAEAALTVALSVLIVTAAALDRRFRLAEMGWFIMLGILTLGWRLVADPGLPSYLDDAPLYEVLLAFGSTLAGLAAARHLLPEAPGRAETRAHLVSALWSFGGVLASILLFRAIDWLDPYGDILNHWTFALYGMIWGLLALAQLYRLRTGARLAFIPVALGCIFGLASCLAFLVSLTILNPWTGISGEIIGPQPFDTLFVAYALPGLLLLGLAIKADWLPSRSFFQWASVGFFATYAFLAIRRFWHGAGVEGWRGFTQPEVYTYTVALLLVGGAVLYQAIAQKNVVLRRVAMVLIGLAVAKVFLIDAAGLNGLLRVFSFLALGLALAGLAWLDRWAAGHSSKVEPPKP